MSKYIVFDNKGETLDRYTVINKDGDILGLSETGVGFSQWCGNVFRFFPGKTMEQIVEGYVEDSDIGELIEFDTLPPELQQHIEMRMAE